MKIGIYKSDMCHNSIIRRPENNKLNVDLNEHCAWCCTAHNFELTEVVIDKPLRNSGGERNG